eukprot:1079278-Pyramimonas_sp.AAC.1
MGRSSRACGAPSPAPPRAPARQPHASATAGRHADSLVSAAPQGTRACRNSRRPDPHGGSGGTIPPEPAASGRRPRPKLAAPRSPDGSTHPPARCGSTP